MLGGQGEDGALGEVDNRFVTLCVRLEVEAEGRLTRFEIAEQKITKNCGTHASEYQPNRFQLYRTNTI